MTLLTKKQKLESLIEEMGSVLVAFSGGVDSTLTLAVSQAVLGENVLAVTARSASAPERELQGAKHLAKVLGVEHRMIDTGEMSSPEYLSNPVNRCYHCKSELYSKLAAIAEQNNIAQIVNGINQDDLGDYRPGIAAAKEAGVASPLADAGMTKRDIRLLSRRLGLPNWDKPAQPCLSSRVPYGQPITQDKLSMIERAEDFLISKGFGQLRVRHHGDVARIELMRGEIPRLFENPLSEETHAHFRALGFKFVTVDLEGFRSGKLNLGIHKTYEER